MRTNLERAHIVDDGDIDLAGVGGGGVRDSESWEEGLTDCLHKREECHKQAEGSTKNRRHQTHCHSLVFTRCSCESELASQQTT